MKRRLTLLLIVLALVGIAVAVAPWTVSTSRLVARIDGQLDAYGLDLDVGGRTTIAFLPVPRVKFEDFRLKAADGSTLVSGGILRGELRVLPLLVGRLELSEVSVAFAKIDVAIDGSGRSGWDATLAALTASIARGQPPGRSRLRRVVVQGSEIAVRDERSGIATQLEEVNLLANQAAPDSAVDLGGNLRWRGELVTLALADLNPHALMNGRASPVSARVLGPGLRAMVTGTAQGGPEPRVTGTSSIEVRSLRDLARWSGAGLPLAPLMELVSLEGAFEAKREALSWREVRLTLGADTLDGALMARFDRGRLSVNGTLAADRLDLTPFLAPLGAAQLSTGAWSAEEISLDRHTRADVDLRLSASSARAGALRLDDLALSLLVKHGRIEASLGRAAVSRGLVRGRLALVAAGESIDLRSQLSFERVDLGALKAETRQARWLAGTANGQLSLESLGASPADLARALHGRGSLNVRSGELGGIGLVEALRRVERRPLSASLDWRNGRTPFDSLGAQVAVANGVA
ncbi:MAG TPA: AsmA family protein, partial [Salinarimonas sp.]|nr:AsmA family protein [Salinarimonas sp.]